MGDVDATTVLELLLVSLAEVVFAQEDGHRGVLLCQLELRAPQRMKPLALAHLERGSRFGVVAQQLEERGLRHLQDAGGFLGGALDLAHALQQRQGREVGEEFRRSAAFIGR